MFPRGAGLHSASGGGYVKWVSCMDSTFASLVPSLRAVLCFTGGGASERSVPRASPGQSDVIVRSPSSPSAAYVTAAKSGPIAAAVV